MSEEEIQGQGFVVKDKRAFDAQGEVKDKSEKTEVGKDKDKEKPKEEKGSAPLPEINFSSFLLSLSSSVLLHLGEIADPQSGEKKKDLVLAKQSIDIINLLQEKTKGNLTQEEEKLLEHLLYDLRMRFVKANK
ncbi:MAG: DUF1844 domain-containing protein [Deltaproteobacteria bacterium]|nr:DUF1844 domain-containing protein [Deltaproteobacteria bacterium]MBW2334849.1 DUF1844 domain-containing protein [Deltaproteobacteria bacterium]